MEIDKPQHFKTYMKTKYLDSCILNASDLRKLYEQLEKKVNEAKEIELKGLEKPKEVKVEDFNKFKQETNDNFKLLFSVFGSNKEQTFGYNSSGLSEYNLPDEIQIVLYDSSIPYKTHFYNREPGNKLEVLINFSKPKLFDFSDPSRKPTPIESHIIISGDNETWVNGVYQVLVDFFKSKEKKRNWIHGTYLYNLLLWLVVMPVDFYITFRVGHYLGKLFENISPILSAGIHVYIFLAILFLYRLIFNYGRWVLPAFEYEGKGTTRMGKHRLFFYSILLTVIGGLVYDLIKYITFKK